MAKKVSIIVPAYNVEKYICQCLDSLVAQTYPDLEILLVDDGSTDKSGTICDGYAERDKRIKVIHEENKGLCGARNTALDSMTGDYVGFVDADDWVEPDMFSGMLAAAEKNNADIVICDWYRHDHLNQDQGIHHRQDIDNQAAVATIRDAYLLNTYDCYMWNKLFTREFWGNTRFPKGIVLQDQYVHAELFRRCQKFYYLDEAYYHYRWYENSSANGCPKTKRKYSMFRSWHEHERVSELCDSVALTENRYYAQKSALEACIINAATDYLKPEQVRELNTYLQNSEQHKSALPLRHRFYWWSLKHTPSLCGLYGKISLEADYLHRKLYRDKF